MIKIKRFIVTVTEILKKEVLIEAESIADAEETAFDEWNDEKIVLTADDFSNVHFNAEEVK